jgi:C1A family cysteine protease
MAKLFIASAGVVAADFDSWAQEFGMQYNGDDYETRKATWEQNDAFYTAENAKGHTYTLGHNQFSAMTNDEFRAMQGFKPRGEHKNTAYLGQHKYNGEALPDSVDWTTAGAVTPVKDQGQCGSCWAFSTTGSLEGANELASGSLNSFSEQQFVDCAGSYGNQGCNGGLMDDGFDYAEATSVCSESSYPYTGTDGSCRASSCTTALAKGAVSGYKDVKANSKEDLMSAVALGPVSIALDGAGSAFQGYKSGILSGSCGSQLDHGVLAVGYGTDAGTDYWLVKNSWGTSWGMNGYIKLIRGKRFASSGECGLLAEPSYPVVSATVAV